MNYELRKNRMGKRKEIGEKGKTGNLLLLHSLHSLRTLRSLRQEIPGLLGRLGQSGCVFGFWGGGGFETLLAARLELLRAADEIVID